MLESKCVWIFRVKAFCIDKPGLQIYNKDGLLSKVIKFAHEDKTLDSTHQMELGMGFVKKSPIGISLGRTLF